MSQDIRSFFLPKGKKTEQSSREESAKKKSKKRVIAIDSDSDEHVEISPKKKRHSDSDKVVDKVKNVNVVKSSEKQSGKLKPVDLSDLFGKETFKKSSPKEVGSNKKEPEVIHSDDEFEATLTQIDEIENAALKTTKDPAAIPVVSKDQSIENDIANAQNTPQKSSRKKKKEKHLEVEKVTESKISDEIPSGSSKIQTPFKTSNNLDTSFGSPSDPLEKKRQQALSYMKYLHRGGPKHPGSKEIPEGKPDCLSGLTFVITGVLDSLEREEAARIVEKYGGKVTSSVSRNTSYLVYGEEAGQSKLTKAESLGTPKINEDGLLKLIVNRSASALSPKETSNVSKKAKKRIKVEKSIDDERNKATKQLKIENSGNEMQDASYSKQNKIESNCSELKLDKTSDSSVQSSLNKSKIIEFPVVGSSSQSHSTVSVESSCVNSSLWVDKYKPTKTKQIIGQQGDRSALKKLTFWLENWHKNHIGKKKLVKPSPWAKNDDGSFFKAALLSGPPGIGKTTMAHLVSKELGFDIVEFNASDTRSKKNLHQEITELLSTKTLVGFFKPDSEDHKTSIKHVLIMDEVDGMAGNEDRGGVQELIQLIKSTRIPIICMCNDRNHPKIRSLANYCFDLRVMKPRLEQIRGAMMSVCYKESIKIPVDSLNDIISGTNFDIRQILHSLCLWTAKDKHLSKEDLSKGSIKPRKDMKMGPWDVVKKVFSVDDHKDMSIHDKSDLFFHDYSINPLFVQENYLSVTPAATRGNIARTLDCIASAADSISMGDVVEKCIRSRGAWSLLPMQAMYSSVIPGTVMEGYMRGQITFPAWLGKNSRTGKLDRLLQELHVHTRLTTSGSKQALNLEYLPHIRGAILHPLITDGSSGVPVTLQVLQSYNLLREDLESILELTMWPNQRDPMSAVDSKVKAALTRAYNKEGILTPYSVVSVIKKRSGERSVEELNETGEGEEEEEEQPDDINNDAMITKKAKKSDAKKTDKKSDEISGKAACGKSKNPIDINSKISQKKGRGKEK